MSKQFPARGAPRHATARRTPFVVLVLGLVVGGLALLLLLNTASAANEVRRHDFAARDASIGAQVEELSNAVAASAAPGNLARAANALGMVPAANPAFLVVGPDGDVRVLGSPAAATEIYVAQAPNTTHKKKTAKKKSTKTKTAAGKTKKSTGKATSTATATSTKAAANGAKSHHKSSPPASPTPTPTPTVTLPGGNR